MGRIVGALVVIVVLYAIISQPLSSAAMVRQGAGALADGGRQVTSFLSTTVGGMAGGSSGSGSTQMRYTPTGGVAAGDGSSVR